MMKKIILNVCTIAAVLSLGATSAFAAHPAAGRNFVDTDRSLCGFVDLDGDGICDNCGISCPCGAACTECGRGCVDADGDGICDHYAAGQARGCGHRNAPRGGCGRNYADTDGDGVCDNYSTAQCRRGGSGARGRCGR